MTYEINIGNVKSQIVQQLPENVVKALRSKLSAETIGAFFARQYSPYAGVKYFFTAKTQVFPTGMLHLVRDVLDKHHIEYDQIDCRAPIKLGQELPLYNVTLRPYQQNAVDLALQKQRGLIRIGTGGGKSSVISGIIAKLNVPTLVLIHKTDIFYQLIGTFERILKIPVGKIGDGECDIQNLTVGMVPSVAHLFDPKVKVLAKEDKVLKEKQQLIINYLNSLGAVITDEAHHLSADTFWLVMQQIPNAIYRFGVTATPFREDNMDILLEGSTAKKFVDISSSWLIENKFLVQPDIYLYDFPHERRQGKDPYGVVYNEEVVNNEPRNELICNLALKAKEAGKSVLVAVTQIEHGKILEKMLQNYDKTAIFVNGQSKPEVRQQILKELGVGTNRIVIATNIYSEGVDAPGLEVLINAKAAASGIDSMQLLGRVLRKADNKTKAWVVDIQDRGKYLTEHSKDRLTIYSEEPKFKLLPVTDIGQINFNV